ncbi:hypothetical protein DSM104299_05133 [Baekduia alba]|uniref:hypothetical protein n=1 Tax=Baekduia alba TaxID=2997333 RepID=UPI0023420DDB|nr:hypothetical protein [Baekduia alba]WCB96374.1 hypothetical protein DSM104299_05133 [Baekduia alba]
MTDLPAYVEFGGLGSAPGPLQCDDTTLYVFGLKADHAKLDALCQKAFNTPTGGAVDYRPLGDTVIVTFGVVGAIRPEYEPWHSMGTVREPQVGFWIPVARVKHDGDKLVAQDFGMFCAAMMLDNPISLLSGREDYGYPKTMGWSTMPDDATQDTAPFTLDVFGMDFGGDEHPERRRLMDLTPVGDELSEVELALGDILTVGEWIKDMLFDRPGVDLGLHFAIEFGKALKDHKVNQVFLKQIRATADGRRADIQQVVVAPAITKNIKVSQLVHDYDLTIQHLDSHPLHDELGIVAQQRVTLALRMRFDFLIDAGDVRWAAPGTTNG